LNRKEEKPLVTQSVYILLSLKRFKRSRARNVAGLSPGGQRDWYLLGVRTVAAIDVVEGGIVVGPGLSTLDCGVGIGVSEGD